MIAAGHRPDDVWELTPRQMQAWLFLATRRRRSQQAEDLVLMAVATQSNQRGIDKQLKDLDG